MEGVFYLISAKSKSASPYSQVKKQESEGVLQFGVHRNFQISRLRFVITYWPLVSMCCRYKSIVDRRSALGVIGWTEPQIILLRRQSIIGALISPKHAYGAELKARMLMWPRRAFRSVLNAEGRFEEFDELRFELRVRSCISSVTDIYIFPTSSSVGRPYQISLSPVSVLWDETVYPSYFTFYGVYKIIWDSH